MMSYNLGHINNGFVLEEKQRDSFSVPQISLPKPTDPTYLGKDVLPERGTYSKSVQSLLLCISMSVGLGNIWRFPNIAYKNGGAAFLLPYLLLLVIIGRPLYYMELIMGQFSSQGPIKVWKCVPAFKGIGYAQVISVSYVIIFYNYLMALSLYYLFASMQSCLPWAECYHSNNSFTENGTLLSGLTPSEHYWKHEVLEETGSLAISSISWKLALCLLLTWVIVYLAVVQGQDSLGKMSYFTAIFPYIVLTALLIVACLQEGAIEGIKYFFLPDLKKLKDIKVWYKACEQSFFSLSIGYGNIVMIASYNKFHNNVYRDAITISVLDTFTNILAGCVIFSVLGTLSVKYNKPVSQVLDHEGLGLAFMAYPEALERIKYVPQLWSVLFFIMLFTLGIGSSMSQIETVLTVIKDRFPATRDRKALLSLGICLLFFLLGLPLTTNSGQIILELLNNFGVGLAVFLYAVLELVGVMWIYGLKNFCRDATFMLNRPVGIFWKVTWSFTAPVALLVIFVYGVVTMEQQDKLPLWATIVGWLLAFVALIQIPIAFVRVYHRAPKGTFYETLSGIFKPANDWGPSDPVIRMQWRSLSSCTPKKNPVNIESTIQTCEQPPAYCNNVYKEEVF